MNPSVCFPQPQVIESLPLLPFENEKALFERVLFEIDRPEQSCIYYLNVHVANTAHQDQNLKKILQSGDVVYCDGAGIALGAKLLGKPLPGRMTAADWFYDLLNAMARENKTVFLLGGEPGVPDAFMEILPQNVPQHTVVGSHHGYILKDSDLESQVIEQINALNPDLLIVGFGTPLQEEWIDRNRHRLQAKAIYAIGAVMDYFVGKVSRCPEWMGERGLEWLYRFCTEPQRLFARYIVGNPWFLSRILFTVTVRLVIPGLEENTVPEKLRHQHRQQAIPVKD